MLLADSDETPGLPPIAPSYSSSITLLAALFPFLLPFLAALVLVRPGCRGGERAASVRGAVTLTAAEVPGWMEAAAG
jgi:hypothetical protein